MHRLLLPIILGFTAVLPQPAIAQDPSFYDCQNERVPIAIAPMPLAEAIERFINVTRCPVSVDTDRVKGRPTRSMRTAAVKGRLTPEQALRRMLRSTPLRAKSIHGGFSVSR